MHNVTKHHSDALILKKAGGHHQQCHAKMNPGIRLIPEERDDTLPGIYERTPTL